MSQILDFWKGMSGTELPFAGANPPSGWLLCNGEILSRTVFAQLFSVIGVTYGAGDGSTTFAIPDMRGRVAAGKDNMGGTPTGRLTNAGSGVDGVTLGATGGSQSHTLTDVQMPSHSHSVPSWRQENFDASGGSFAGGMDAGAGGGQQAANAIVTGTAGSWQAHNNTQPTIILNHIIKI